MQNNPVIFFKTPFNTTIIFCLLFLLLLALSFSFKPIEHKQECSYQIFILILSILIGKTSLQLVFNIYQFRKEFFCRKATILELNDYVCNYLILFPCIVLLILFLDCSIRPYLCVMFFTFLLTLVYTYLLNLINFKYSQPEIQDLCEELHLNVGCGLAVNYYYNYLRHCIPEVFKERVRHFSTVQQIKVIEKLFILLPHSCKVKKHIDITKQIERARELPSLVLDVAGIKGREYNITVYHVRPNVDGEGYWCAVEYAQPLRQLWDLHNQRKITTCQMQQERQWFKQTLDELLHDEHDSYKVYVLSSYDDTTETFNEADLLQELCETYS